MNIQCIDSVHKNNAKHLCKSEIFDMNHHAWIQPAVTCSNLIIETLEQGKK